MNKYELAVVLSVKLEDEERAAAIEKVTGKYCSRNFLKNQGIFRDFYLKFL